MNTKTAFLAREARWSIAVRADCAAGAAASARECTCDAPDRRQQAGLHDLPVTRAATEKEGAQLVSTPSNAQRPYRLPQNFHLCCNAQSDVLSSTAGTNKLRGQGRA